MTIDVKLWKDVWLWKELFLIFRTLSIIITSNNFGKKSWKLHFRYFSYVVIFVCNTDLAIFASLHFLPIILGNYFFCVCVVYVFCLLWVLNSMSWPLYNHCLYKCHLLISHFVFTLQKLIFICKNLKSSYKNSVLTYTNKKTCFQKGFEVFEKLFKKKTKD